MIEYYSFGKIIICSREYTSDIIIVSGTVHSWWRAQGHVLNPGDLTLVIEASPKVLVVGTGSHGGMKISETTRKFLLENQITLIAEKTGKAVEIFNNLLETKAAALHLTC
ncbi:MAG: hypothetical protein HXS53_10555 [Theionarchaea archaeon]|nr:hypothetical protein [Theionarchaea archaeon]